MPCLAGTAARGQLASPGSTTLAVVGLLSQAATTRFNLKGRFPDVVEELARTEPSRFLAEDPRPIRRL